MATFRNELKDLREAAELSQSELAKKIRSQQPQIARWEKQPDDPKYRLIPLDMAVLVADALDVPLWRIRPDILTKDSPEPLMEGLSAEARKEVLRYIKFIRQQENLP